MAVLHRFIFKPPPRHHALAVVFDQDITFPGQFIDQCLAFGPGEINRDTALVAVGGQEEMGFATDFRRLHAPRVIAMLRMLDLDDLRPQVRHLLRRQRASQHAGKIENTNARKRFIQFNAHAFP